MRLNDIHFFFFVIDRLNDIHVMHSLCMPFIKEIFTLCLTLAFKIYDVDLMSIFNWSPCLTIGEACSDSRKWAG